MSDPSAGIIWLLLDVNIFLLMVGVGLYGVKKEWCEYRPCGAPAG